MHSRRGATIFSEHIQRINTQKTATPIFVSNYWREQVIVTVGPAAAVRESLR